MKDVYQEVTDRMIARLEQGAVPWRKPWGAGTGTDWPTNIKSKKRYHSSNIIILVMAAAEAGYRSPWWGTFNQWAEATGMVRVPNKNRPGEHWESPDGTRRGVRKGQHGELIIWWGRVWITTDELDDKGRKIRKQVPHIQASYVFNAEQVDQAPAQYLPAPAEAVEPDLALKRGQEILDTYLGRDGAPGFHEDGGNRAYYGLERDDNIHIPARISFPDEREYYSTAFHEAGHSTGHPKRLNRPGIENFDHFGSEQYSKEELIAEITSTFLMATAGINSEGTFTNSAAYVGNWLGKLRNDKKLVVSAAAAAQHAADYILGVTEDHEDEEH